LPSGSNDGDGVIREVKQAKKKFCETESVVGRRRENLDVRFLQCVVRFIGGENREKKTSDENARVEYGVEGPLLDFVAGRKPQCPKLTTPNPKNIGSTHQTDTVPYRE
jgi:hypothetical protein